MESSSDLPVTPPPDAFEAENFEAPATELSELLGRYFWDYAPGRLSWPQNRFTIIWRLLEKGGLEGAVWLQRNVTNAELRDFIIERRGRAIDPKWLRYWERILDLPEEQVNAWVATALKNPWYQRIKSG